MSRCPWCVARYGEQGRPEHFGSDPKCAFPDGGDFTDDNWNCVAMGQLRLVAEKNATGSEDQNLGVIPWDAQFVVLSWYKSRGRTEGAWRVEDNISAPLHIGDVWDLVSDGIIPLPGQT